MHILAFFKKKTKIFKIMVVLFVLKNHFCGLIEVILKT